jgi:hypothetical protein
LAKSATAYVCSNCAAQTRQFFGRCASCGSWNTLVEQLIAAPADRRRRPQAEIGAARPEPQARRSTPIGAVAERPLERLGSGYGELDRVLGGGLVPGSLVLLGGDPGIGKSTLLLQSARAMAARASVLYVSAEESAQQVTLRWRRLAEVRSRAKSVFHFDVPGSVAKSTHSGLPWLRHLRQQLGPRVHFWPFDGWTPPPGHSVMAEVYPSLWSKGFPNEDRTPDQHDAFSVAHWMQKTDAIDALDIYFRPQLSSTEREQAMLEGWILGII